MKKFFIIVIAIILLPVVWHILNFILSILFSKLVMLLIIGYLGYRLFFHK
jgi:vacuolar-type H+-ATPase subunit I/STV1